MLGIHAQAQTNYYVATSGNDGTGDGTSGNPWRTIQYAINHSNGGDIVHAAAGTYNESVLINKTLTLQGADTTTIISPVSGVGISIAASNVSISNLKVAHALSAGIASIGSISSLSLANVKCDADSVGAQLSNVDGLLMEGCVFLNSKGDGFYASPGMNFTFNNCTASANGNPSGSGFLFRNVTGTSTLTNITANHNKTHGLDIRNGTTNITVHGGDFEYNGTTNLSDGGGISLFALSAIVSNITLNGPLTSSNNITCGVYIDAHNSSNDSINGLTIGQAEGTVSFSSNGTSQGAGILLWGNISDVTVTANFSKGTISNSAGFIIVGRNGSGSSSPRNITIVNSVFQVGYTKLTPAIALADASSPTYIDINDVTATSNTFLGASGFSAIDDSLIFDKLDNIALGRVNQTDNRITLEPPGISVQPQIIDFGPVKLALHKDTTITIQNTGGNKLSIPTITSTGSVFTAEPIVETIPAGQSFSESLHFAPNKFGSFSDTLVFHNNSPTPALRIPVYGNSPYPVCATLKSFITYGDVAENTTKKDTVKVIDSSINTLIVDSIYTKTSAFAVDRISGTVGIDTLKLVVLFTPTAFANYADTLYLRNNSDSPIIKISLSGSSPVPTILCNPRTITFGDVRKDSTQQLFFTITNSSISVLQIDSFWTKTKYFDVTHMLTFGQVRSSDSIKVAIRFTPDSSRSYIDTMFIANNSSAFPFIVPLSGNGTTTGVMQYGSEIPKAYSLSQNYPNPFNPSTIIQYGLPVRSTVRLIIYNMLGQVVKELINSEQQAGHQSVVWNAIVASGMYFYRIEAISLEKPSRRFLQTKRMLLLK
jgi:hypothetical protein